MSHIITASRAGKLTALLLCLALLLGFGLSSAQAFTAYEQEVLDLINAERARQGIEPLTEDPILQQCSRIRAQEIVISFSHKRPDGTAWKTVFDQVGFTAELHSENLAGEHETPKDAFDGWMKSKSHRENMLNPEYTRVGLCSAEGDKGYTFYNLLLATPN